MKPVTGQPSSLRYVGLIWSLFLIGHIYLSGFIARLGLLNGHHKDMMRLDYELKIWAPF